MSPMLAIPPSPVSRPVRPLPAVSLAHFSPERLEGKKSAVLVLVFPSEKGSVVRKARASLGGCLGGSGGPEEAPKAGSEVARERNEVLHAISDAGLAFEWLDADRALVYASPRRLMREAARMRLPLELDARVLRQLDVEMNAALFEMGLEEFDPEYLRRQDVAEADGKDPRAVDRQGEVARGSMAIPRGWNPRDAVEVDQDPDAYHDLEAVERMRRHTIGCRRCRNTLCHFVAYCSCCMHRDTALAHEIGPHGKEPDPDLLDPYAHHFYPLRTLRNHTVPPPPTPASALQPLILTAHDTDGIHAQLSPLHLNKRLLHAKPAPSHFLPLPLSTPEALRVLSSILVSPATKLELEPETEGGGGAGGGGVGMKKEQVHVPREGAGLDLDKLVADGWLVDHFVVHDQVKVSELSGEWVRWDAVPWSQPIDKVREYFGEEVGFYFAFLGHLSAWLIPLAVAGIPFAIANLALTTPRANPVLALTPVLVAVWSSLFIVSWRQRESILALRWGVIDLPPSARHVRPLYAKDRSVNRPVRSLITGIADHYDVPAGRRLRSCTANSLFILFFAIVGAIVFGGAVLKLGTISANFDPVASFFLGFVFTIQIVLLNIVNPTVTHFLTTFENWRFTDEHDRVNLVRLSVINIFNNFGAVGIVGFLGPVLPRSLVSCSAHDGDCSSEVFTLIASVFISVLVINNLMEVGAPIAKNFALSCCASSQPTHTSAPRDVRLATPPSITLSSHDEEEGGVGKEAGEEEVLDGDEYGSKYHVLDPPGFIPKGLLLSLNSSRKSSIISEDGRFVTRRYDVNMDDARGEPAGFDDFNEVMVLIGWSLFFFPFFPFAPLLTLINNHFEVRIDAVKALWAHQRPLPTTVSGIGAYDTIFTFFSYLAVLTSTALLVMNTNAFRYGNDTVYAPDCSTTTPSLQAPGACSSVLFNRALPRVTEDPLQSMGVLGVSVAVLAFGKFLIEWLRPSRHPAVDVQLERKEHLVRRFVLEDLTEDEMIAKASIRAHPTTHLSDDTPIVLRTSSGRRKSSSFRIDLTSMKSLKVMPIRGGIGAGSKLSREEALSQPQLLRELGITRISHERIKEALLRAESDSRAHIAAALRSTAVQPVELAFLMDNLKVEAE